MSSPAPHGLPPWIAELSPNLPHLYPIGTKLIPWWAKNGIQDRAVVSCPLACEEVEKKTPANFPYNDPLAHNCPQESKKAIKHKII